MTQYLTADTPALPTTGFDLLSRLLCLNPAKRISAEEARRHEWFRERPLPKEQVLMPTYTRRENRPKVKHLAPSPDPRLGQAR